MRAPVPEEGFLAARLHFDRKPAANEAEVRELLARRKATQPIGAWSCGSVFTNPPGDHAARLIEAAGLKGFRIGDAGGVAEARQLHHQLRCGLGGRS